MLMCVLRVPFSERVSFGPTCPCGRNATAADEFQAVLGVSNLSLTLKVEVQS